MRSRNAAEAVVARFSLKFGSKGKSDKHLAYLIETLNRQVQGFSQLDPSFGRLIDSTLLETRKSDTAFILGSGPSISGLSPSELHEISVSDSFGFNFWLAHEMVPTHYILQLPRQAPYRTSMLELLRLKRDSYRKSHILVRGDHTFSGPTQFSDLAGDFLPEGRLWFIPELAINSQVELEPYEMMKFFEFLGFLNHGYIGRAVPKWRVTLGLLLSLTYQMGYGRIVLCGIDMNDSTHFFDNRMYQGQFHGILLPEPGLSNANDRWMSAKYSRNTVSRYVSEFARFAYERAGTQLFLASPGSRLEGIIPDWEFGRKGS